MRSSRRDTSENNPRPVNRKPRVRIAAGVLVIGSTSELGQRQKDSFNQFRHTLHSLTVITFDELLNRLKLLFGAGDRDDDIPWPDQPMDDASDWEDEPDHSEDPPC